MVSKVRRGIPASKVHKAIRVSKALKAIPVLLERQEPLEQQDRKVIPAYRVFKVCPVTPVRMEPKARRATKATPVYRASKAFRACKALLAQPVRPERCGSRIPVCPPLASVLWGIGISMKPPGMSTRRRVLRRGR
jgi:hypothetical protein